MLPAACVIDVVRVNMIAFDLDWYQSVKKKKSIIIKIMH